ncbi:MAG: hypothetical protein HQM08_27830 [Candidatus Riflebacteria bacterium]|nr:hypothetical protein [Candidatus Riflebacteria bacterium]
MNKSELKTSLEISPNYRLLEPSKCFVFSFAKQLGLDDENCNVLAGGMQAAVNLVVQTCSGSNRGEPIKISLSETAGKIEMDILNQGIPLASDDLSILDKLLKKFDAPGEKFEQISIENHGRLGQSICFNLSKGRSAIPPSVLETGENNSSEEIDPENIEIRLLKHGEEADLSRLFFFVYEYKYINEFIYYPEKVRLMIDSGDLISIVAALPNGRLVGHAALRKWNSNPSVYEPCLGLIDPRVKSRGFFGKIFNVLFEKAREIPMQYCFLDFVTNHDYSQRLIAKYGSVDLSVFVGCQSPATQARLRDLGIGKDPVGTDRYSILYSIIPMTRQPFGEAVYLPNTLGSELDFILKALNMEWYPSPRFNPLAPDGEYKTLRHGAQLSVYFGLEFPGKKALENLLNEWKHLLREGYKYAAVDVPLDQPGFGIVHEILTNNGFFISGFMPFRNTGRLGFRFQAVAPFRIDFNEIKIFSENGKKLLSLIKELYERINPND